MFRRKFIGLGASLLMILALSLPVAPLATPALAVTGVTSVAPTSGGTGGGTAVTITGVDFMPGTCTAAEMTPVTTVVFDSAGTPAPATSVVVTSDTTITAVTSSHVAGPPAVGVSVTQGVPPSACTAAATGPITGATLYTYVNPTLAGISPSGGPTTGGTVVTITGTNLEGTTSVTIDGVAAPITGTPTSTSITATTGPHPVAGTFVVCVDNPAAPTPNTCGPITFSYGVATLTPIPGTATTTVTAIPGVQTVSGVVVGTGPLALIGPRVLATGVTGAPSGSHRVPRAHVVLVNQSTGAAFGTHTAGTEGGPYAATDGTFSITGVPPGSYRLSVADSDDESGQTGCASVASTACGHLINQQIITVVSTGGNIVPTIVLAPKAVPGALPTGATTGIFGEARDATTGNPISGATVTSTGGLAGSTITGADGRWSITGTTAGLTTVTIVPVSGTCTAGTVVDLCTDTILVVAGWNDPAFLAVGAGVLPTPSAAGIGSGVLQGVIPMVFRDTDTSRTGGIDIETEQIRVVNAGPARTIACLDFRSSDVDGRVTTTQRQCLDLNPSAVGLFSGDIIPSGIMGMAEMYSVDFDGGCTAGLVGAGTATPTPGTSAISGCVYDVSDLHATIMYRVAEADNATAGTNALTCEDVLGSTLACGIGGTTTSNQSQNVIIPIAFKNYGGTPAKWDSIINACMTSGVPGRQPLVIEFIGSGDTAGQGTFLETRSADPGGCISLNLRDIAYLPDGTWMVNLTSTGLLGPVTTPGGITLPNAFFGAGVAYSRQGRLATAHNGISPQGAGARFATTSRAYAPLIFGDYTVGGGAWYTGIGIANFPITGTSGSVSFTLTLYDDAGTVRGVMNERLSGQVGRAFWLGHQPGTENRGLWYGRQLVVPLERNFRGALIIDAGDASGAARPTVFMHHTNYARNAAISYNATRDEAVNPTAYGLAASAPNTRPCVMPINTALLGDTCIFAAEAVRVARGPTTGIRLFNPTALAETVDVQYFDSAGVEWTDSRTTFSIGPFGTATLFLGTDNRLPAQFNGSLYLASNADITAIANVIDYGVTTRDSARAYNLPSQAGLTQ